MNPELVNMLVNLALRALAVVMVWVIMLLMVYDLWKSWRNRER